VSCPHLVDVGAYVVDALEPEERLRLERHLAACDACAAEVRDLAALPGLLASVPAPETVEPAPVPTELAFRRLHRSATAAAAQPAPRRRSVRRWALAAAAVLVLGGAGAAGVLASSGSPAAPSTVSASEGALHARASIASTPDGSRITLALAGVPSGQQCELTVQARDGHWETASSWTVDYEGTAHVSGTVRIRPQDLTRLVVRTVAGRTLVTMHA
jgi:anti-sigma factor RsiW